MRFSPRGSEKKGSYVKRDTFKKIEIRPRDHHIRGEGVRFCAPEGPEKKRLCQKRYIQTNRKFNLGTITFEQRACDFPPEGPEKRDYVKRDTFNKNRKLDLGTIKVESGMSGLGPEVPKKRHCGGMCQILSRRNARIDR